MSARPAISIITPTLNRRDKLERAIRSVQRQTMDDYEHIIIDDGSHDGTAQFAHGIDDRRVRFFRFDNWQGANSARNFGVQKARGKWITFLDSDDEFLPHRLESTLDRCSAEADVKLFISSFRVCKHARLHDAVNPEIHLSGAQLERALMSYALAIAGTAITVARRRLTRAGGFAPTLMRLQDRELLLRLSRFGGARLSTDVDWIKHHSSDSISGPREGYVEAVGAMLDLHPNLADRYRGILKYHISRQILRDMLLRKVSAAFQNWRENCRSPHLRFRLWELVQGYRIGKKWRSAVLNELRESARDDANLRQSLPIQNRDAEVVAPVLSRAA